MTDQNANPFLIVNEPREHIITVRLTKTELKAVQVVAGPERGAIAELIREGLALAIEARRKPKGKK